MTLSETPISAGRKEVVFIDTGVADWQTLVDGIRPDIEVVLLDGHRDGLAQMAEWARNHSGYDAIHVLSHGAEGSLRLDRDTVTQASLAEVGVQTELAQLGQALAVDGDLLLYGCEVGAGETGRAFTKALANATGADIAASSDLTGSGFLGGNWTLEVATGNVDTAAIHPLDFAGVLASSTTINMADSSIDQGTVYARPNGTSYTWSFGTGWFRYMSNPDEYLPIRTVWMNPSTPPPGGCSVEYSTNGGGSWTTLSTSEVSTAGTIFRYVNNTSSTSNYDFTFNYSVNNSAYIAGSQQIGSWITIKPDTAPTDISLAYASQVTSTLFTDTAQGTTIGTLTPTDTGNMRRGYWAIDSETVPNLFTLSSDTSSGNTATLKLGSGTPPSAGQSASVTVRYYDLFQTDTSNNPLAGSGFSKIYTFDFAAESTQDLADFGNDLALNTTTADAQTSPALAQLSTGNFVAVWISTGQSDAASKTSIVAQVFSSTGTKIGNEIVISQANNNADEYYPTVAALDNGRFVVAYLSSTNSTDYDIRYVLVAADGTAGSEQIANAAIDRGEDTLAITTLSDGSFMIDWGSYAPDWNSMDVLARKFSATDGSPLASEITVRAGADVSGSAIYPSIAPLSGGSYVASWTEYDSGWVSTGVYGRVGTGTPFQITTDTDAYGAKLAALAGGGFVAAWEHSTDVYYRIYSSAGVAQGAATCANITTTGTQGTPAIVALSGGGFLVGWQSDTGDYSGTGVFGRRFAANGTAVDASDVEINQHRLNGQSAVALAATTGNTFIAAWQDDAANGANNSGIEGRLLLPSVPTVSSVTSSTADGSYNAGDVISIQVTFSESVTVTGTPQLTLETGTTDCTVNYASGSPGTTLTFNYTVQAGDTSSDLDYTGTGALALNSGTIVATSGGAAATRTLPTPGAANSLGNNKAIVIDTTAPSAPGTPDMTTGTDSGSSSTDNITSDNTPTFTGTGENGATVTLFNDANSNGVVDGGESLGTATVSGGNWSITSSALTAGSHPLKSIQTDAAGNTSTASTGLSVTIDTTAPSAPSTPDMTAGTDSGTSDTDNLTSDTTPTFTGTAEANATVTLISSVNGTVGTASADGSGNWSITASTLNSGAHTMTATTTDAAGNTSSASSGLSVSIDTTVPTITFSALNFSADTGSSGTDFNTGTAAQTIGATLSAGLGGGDIVYGSLDNGGNWTNITGKVSGTTLTWDGVTLAASNTLKLKVTDAAGNDGTVASQAYVLDTTAPGISAVSIPNATMKVGATVTATITVADDGGVTYTLGSSTIGGFALSNLLRTNSTTYTAQFTVTEGGTDVAAGSNIPVSVILTDTAGNSNSAYTTAISQAGDTLNAHSPTDIALANNSVALIGGVNAVVGALSSTDGSSGETFTYSLVAGAGSTDNASFNISGSNLRANDAGVLTAGNSYSVRLRTTDAAGNTFEEAFTVNAVVGPAIAGATYDAASGVLTVTGSLMEALAGADNDIDVSKLTLTGEGGETYILTSGDVEITSATEFSVTLNATDKAALNLILNKNGTSSTSGTNFNLAAADDWNTNVTTGDTGDASSTVTVSSVAVPAITSAAYDYATNTLVVTGTGFLKKSGATNDIDISKLTFTGEGGASYTLTSASDVEIASATQFTVTLAGADLTSVETLLNKDGTAAVSTTPYNLAAAEDWAVGADAAVTVADTTGNGIMVSNWAAPAVTSAAYNWSTGQLALTGSNFVSASGATNDVIASKLTITGEGGSYTLTDSANVEISSATSATLTLSATDQLNLHGLLNKNGLTSDGAITYNVAADDDWMAGSPTAGNIADATGNAITVSNVAAPTITSATYDSDSGILQVTGTNLFKKIGATNDVDISTLTFTGGTANATYTLTSASDVEIASATSFSVTLSGADKTGVDALLDQIGTQSTGGSTYNLAAGEDWLAGADAAANIADAVSAVTVSISPRITSAAYDANTGVLVVTGANIQANGGGMDINASKLTLTGEGGATYALTDTADVERDSVTQFTLTLSATDKAALNQIVNQNGLTSTGTTAYNLAAADDWDTNVTAGDTSDLTGNAVTASNVVAPTITSATYNAATGALVVTGSGFLKRNGATNDIVANKFTLTGEGGATYTLTDSASVEITSGTAFTVTLSATDLAAVNQILNKTGTNSTGATPYNLAAAEDWAAGADAAVVVADLTGNGITVSNPTTPTIAGATYNTVTGTLVVTGSGFLKLDGATNDVVANKFTITGQGGVGATYTLTDSSNVEITSGTSFTLTLSATDKAAVAALINQAGTSATDTTVYNLAAAEDWAAGADAAVNVVDATNGITATLNQAPVITSNGGGAAAAVNVAENATAVTTVTASDADSDTPTFSLSGGTDQAKFTINAASGALAFATAPDFETPTDSDTNNTYVVQVTADDGHGGSDVQTITVTVTDVGEGGGGTPPPPPSTTVDGATVSTNTTTSGGQTTTTQTVAPVTDTRQEDTSTPNSTLADIPLVTNSSGETVLQVSLPVGVGLTSQTITGTSTLRDLLIAASDPKVENATVFDQILAHGIDAYVPGVQDQSQVTVRTITFTETTVASGQTIIVTGALGTGEDNAQNPLRQEALVIDTRNLPSGTVLNFDNVEFAIVIGAISLAGGNGRNFVIGDDAAQYIVLGAEDDELHGGGGNDFVGSKSGNDKLYGDEGDDTVSGGDGNDVLDGGTGNDLMLGGKDSDTATFSGASGSYQVSYEFGKTVVRSLADANDVETVVNVETLRFADKSVNVTHTHALEWLATLYRQSLGRQADLGGFQYWAQTAAGGTSDGEVALGFLRSAESRQKAGAEFDKLDAAGQIEYLYTQLLGRASEASGKESWLQQYANGANMRDIAWNFVHSAELTGQYLVPEGWDFFV